MHNLPLFTIFFIFYAPGVIGHGAFSTTVAKAALFRSPHIALVAFCLFSLLLTWCLVYFFRLARRRNRDSGSLGKKGIVAAVLSAIALLALFPTTIAVWIMVMRELLARPDLQTSIQFLHRQLQSSEAEVVRGGGFLWLCSLCFYLLASILWARWRRMPNKLAQNPNQQTRRRHSAKNKEQK